MQPRSPDPQLLDRATVGAWLAEQGLLEAGMPVHAVELEWGVSNVVLAVEAGELRAVVKQALPRLRVEEEWLAKRERSLTEARALELAARLAPGSVPAVLAVDQARCAFAIARAPGGWRNWKELLLAGESRADVGARLGTLLATIHAETSRDGELLAEFDDAEAFAQLRIDPYHRTVMRRWPGLERPVGMVVEEMLDRRLCLVHGDFSPKNVLVGDDGLWLIDFEVAHAGDPAFDLGFMLNHLMLKAIHRPAAFERYEHAAASFWETYGGLVPGSLTPDPAYVGLHVACLMLARVDGKSPAEYLTEGERLLARSLATRFLVDPPATLQDAWVALGAALR
jgi:5-methylthioribose kinase